MNEALHFSASSALGQLPLSALRRTRRDEPAANDPSDADLPAAAAIDAWARRAAASNGFGDLPAQDDASASFAADVYRRARAVRSQAMGMLVSTLLARAWTLVQRTRARYRVYRAARETYRALRSLDDRTLHDLGYDRSEIQSVAVEVATSRGGWS